MKVILNADVDALGLRGDVVDVADGYARNFLLPRNLAINATKGALRQAEAMQRARQERDLKEREAAQEMAGRITGAALRIPARAGEEGRLFGAVTNTDIAALLSESLGEEIDRRKVEVPEPIGSVGEHPFRVHLHAEVVAEGRVEVVAAPSS